MFVCRSLLVLAALAVLLTASTAPADSVVDNCKVIKVEDRRLWVKGPSGGEHNAEVAADARITVDGKAARLSDLKGGMTARLTVRKSEGPPVILAIEARK